MANEEKIINILSGIQKEITEFRTETNDRLKKLEINDVASILSAVRESQEILSAKIDKLEISTATTKAIENIRHDIAKELREAANKIEKIA